jgi:hypothetical protein
MCSNMGLGSRFVGRSKADYRPRPRRSPFAIASSDHGHAWSRPAAGPRRRGRRAGRRSRPSRCGVRHCLDFGHARATRCARAPGSSALIQATPRPAILGLHAARRGRAAGRRRSTRSTQLLKTTGVDVGGQGAHPLGRSLAAASVVAVERPVLRARDRHRGVEALAALGVVRPEAGAQPADLGRVVADRRSGSGRCPGG